MRPRRGALQSQRRAALPATRSLRAARERSDYWAVCLVGFEGPIPRRFGDNYGVWPVRIVVAKREKTAAAKDDLAQPLHKVVVLEHVVVQTEVHGKRLKEELDKALLGEVGAKGNGTLRRSWRDMRGAFEDEFTRSIWWGVIVESALRELVALGRARAFPVMDGAERDRRTAQSRKPKWSRT